MKYRTYPETNPPFTVCANSFPRQLLDWYLQNKDGGSQITLVPVFFGSNVTNDEMLQNEAFIQSCRALRFIRRLNSHTRNKQARILDVQLWSEY